MGMHERMRAMVIRQLAPQPKGKGVPITFTKRSGGGYDPITGEDIPVTVTEFTSSGLRVNYSDKSYVNSTITYGDFQIYLSPVLVDGVTDTPTPSIRDTFNFLGKEVSVINVDPFNDNSVGCGWKLQVRHG
jgi:hypothetical protein